MIKRIIPLLLILVALLCGCKERASFSSAKLIYDSGASDEFISNELSENKNVIYFTDKIKKGKPAEVIIKSKPDTYHEIYVYYGENQSRSNALVPHLSDKNGLVHWKWSTSKNIKSDTAKVEIYCGTELVFSNNIKLSG